MRGLLVKIDEKSGAVSVNEYGVPKLNREGHKGFCDWNAIRLEEVRGEGLWKSEP